MEYAKICNPVVLALSLFLGLILWTPIHAQPVATLLKKAEKEASAGHMLQAAELWERVGRLKNSDPEWLFQAAEAYTQVRDYLRAADCYRATLMDKRYPLAPLRYARALKQQGRYDEAAQGFESFAQTYQGDFKAVMLAVADNEILGCEWALQGQKTWDTTFQMLTLKDSVNTLENEFAPIPFSDQLLYYAVASPERAQLMRSKWRDTIWGFPEEAKSLPEAVSKHFRTGCFSADGSRFYYAQCANGCPAERGGSVANAACSIFCLRRTEEGWGNPEQLRAYINLEGTSAMFPQVAQAEGLEYLFFSSDRVGGFGGLDIYACERPLDSEELDFSFPQNLGRNINTGADEVTPFYQTDTKTLWFSSLGHPSIGGFDIFKAEKEDGYWSKPQNVGLPFNSPADDYFFVFKKSGYGAFLSSNRSFQEIKMHTTDDDIFEVKW